MLCESVSEVFEIRRKEREIAHLHRPFIASRSFRRQQDIHVRYNRSERAALCLHHLAGRRVRIHVRMLWHGSSIQHAALLCLSRRRCATVRHRSAVGGPAFAARNRRSPPATDQCRGIFRGPFAADAQIFRCFPAPKMILPSRSPESAPTIEELWESALSTDVLHPMDATSFRLALSDNSR